MSNKTDAARRMIGFSTAVEKSRFILDSIFGVLIRLLLAVYSLRCRPIGEKEGERGAFSDLAFNMNPTLEDVDKFFYDR